MYLHVNARLSHALDPLKARKQRLKSHDNTIGALLVLFGVPPSPKLKKLIRFLKHSAHSHSGPDLVVRRSTALKIRSKYSAVTGEVAMLGSVTNLLCCQSDRCCICKHLARDSLYWREEDRRRGYERKIPHVILLGRRIETIAISVLAES